MTKTVDLEAKTCCSLSSESEQFALKDSALKEQDRNLNSGSSVSQIEHVSMICPSVNDAPQSKHSDFNSEVEILTVFPFFFPHIRNLESRGRTEPVPSGNFSLKSTYTQPDFQQSH